MLSRWGHPLFINGLMAARMGDLTIHGGTITVGCPTVLIGIPAQAAALSSAASTGAPFVQKCDG